MALGCWYDDLVVLLVGVYLEVGGETGPELILFLFVVVVVVIEVGE